MDVIDKVEASLDYYFYTEEVNAIEFWWRLVEIFFPFKFMEGACHRLGRYEFGIFYGP